MDKAWVLSIRDQCRQAQVAWFFKQWGGTRKSKAGRELDGRTYDEVPARIQLPVLDDAQRKAHIAEVGKLYPPRQEAAAPDLFAAQP
jgi:hypothetical protein